MLTFVTFEYFPGWPIVMGINEIVPSEVIPAAIAFGYRVVPIREIGSTLVLATDGDTGTEARSRLVFILEREVRFVVRSRDWMEAQFDAHFRTPVELVEGSNDNSTAELIEGSTDNTSVCWYWPSCHILSGDKLIVKTSGWTGDTHWSGADTFPVDHPDREFWNWLITIANYSRGLLSVREIPKIKRIWNRYRRRSKAATNNPMHRSGGSSDS